MLRYFSFLLTAVLLSVSSYGQDGTVESLEAGVTLKMLAPINDLGERKFYLEIRTNTIYECSDYILHNEASIEGNRLQIKVKGVEKLDPCTPSMAPARAWIDLSKFKHGKYKIRVVISRQVFKANLTISDEYYTFEIPNEDPSLFRIYNETLRLIPENTIWGVCEYSDANIKDDAEAFMKELEKMGALKADLIAGSYGDFYLHYDGTVEEKEIGDFKYHYAFVYHYTGDINIFADLVNSYRNKMNITIKSTNGQVLRDF